MKKKKRKESIVDVRTHFKPTKASVPIHTFLFVTRRVKNDLQRANRTNSSEETFEENINNFKR